MSAYSPEQVASLLNCTTRTLANWRSNDTGPAFVRVGHSIQYPEQALIDWLAERVTIPAHSRLPAAQVAHTLDHGEQTSPVGAGLMGGFDQPTPTPDQQPQPIGRPA